MAPDSSSFPSTVTFWRSNPVAVDRQRSTVAAGTVAREPVHAARVDAEAGCAHAGLAHMHRAIATTTGSKKTVRVAPRDPWARDTERPPARRRSGGRSLLRSGGGDVNAGFQAASKPNRPPPAGAADGT